MSDEGEGTRKAGTSVTTVPCACSYLSRAADEPDSSIVFDADMNEYKFRVGPGHMIIRHCPWCGGTAPKSKRSSLFAQITDAEMRRLGALTKGIKTVEEAIEKFGPPDNDRPAGMTIKSPGTGTTPETVESHRVLTYNGLSDTATVSLVDYGPSRGLGLTLSGKYIGKPGSNT